MSDSYKVVSLSAHELPKDARHLIYSSWKRTLRYGNDYFKIVDQAAYFAAYERYISFVLHQPHAVVRLAVLTDDPDVILGFSVYRGNVLDYVYVLKDQRRQGIGAKLVPRGIDTISHVTKTGITIWQSKYKEWKLDPFN